MTVVVPTPPMPVMTVAIADGLAFPAPGSLPPPISVVWSSPFSMAIFARRIARPSVLVVCSAVMLGVVSVVALRPSQTAATGSRIPMPQWRRCSAVCMPSTEGSRNVSALHVPKRKVLTETGLSPAPRVLSHATSDLLVLGARQNDSDDSKTTTWLGDEAVSHSRPV